MNDRANGEPAFVKPPTMDIFWPINMKIEGTMPNEVAVVPVVANGQARIAMQIATPCGVNFVFLSHDAAKFIGEKLIELTRSIVVAPASALL